MDQILKIKDLNIKLQKNNKSIVKDIAFKARKGRILGIIGESGSGKTLSCKAIMRLLNRKVFTVSGNIYFKDKELLKMSKREVKSIIGRDISMIMQNPMTAFDPMMKIGNQIVETLQAHIGLRKKEAYLKGIKDLKKMNLYRGAEIMNSYPHTLSGGMLQRVMIAISLMLEPDLIIADEATTSLDLKTQSIILNEFQRIRNSGIALIVITHDFGVIARIADDVIVMKDGEILESGTVHKIFNAPSTGYTKELLRARVLKDEVSYA